MITTSLGAFAGSAQSALQNVYDTERAEDGWTTFPLSEPAGFVNYHRGHNPSAESAELSDGLFEYGLSSSSVPGELNLYIRTLPDGSPVEVGPMFSRAILESHRPEETGHLLSEPSASSSLGSVLFAIMGPGLANEDGADYLWPGDTTVENTGTSGGTGGFFSLYQYSGTDNLIPALVGVNPALVSVNNPSGLISQCGTSLGFPHLGSFERQGADENYNAISKDGSRVFFTAGGATEGSAHDACTATGEGRGPLADELFARTGMSMTTAISEPSKEDCMLCDTSEPDVRNAIFQGASEDGSKVFFLTAQPLLKSDEDEAMDLYEYDFNAPAGERITQISRGGTGDPTPGRGAQVKGVARVSEDGSRVYFVAEGVLTSALSPTGYEARQGADNLYVYNTETGQTAFIGRLSQADERDWQQRDSRPVDATPPNGRFLVFTSSADLTRDDTSDVAQVFEYDAEAGTLVRVSVGQDGFNNDGNTDEYPASITHQEYIENYNPAPQLSSVSDDGTYVVFQSSDALTPGAAAGANNVYEYRGGQVSLISDGLDRTSKLFNSGPSTALVGIDGSGADIFFETADSLVPQDGDTQIDVYDARIDGGFPAPAVSPGCEGDGCQGALAPAPSFSAVGSVSQPAGEEIVEPVVGPAVKVKPRRKKAKARRVRAGSKGRGKAGRRARVGSNHHRAKSTPRRGGSW